MRKFSAILLICIFTFSQYARHLSYLECKIMNISKPASHQCDCEKYAGFEKTGPEKSPAPKAHLHIHLDEYFSRPVEVEQMVITTAPLEEKLPQIEKECTGFFKSPWQPPKS